MTNNTTLNNVKWKVELSLRQAVEVCNFDRRRGSHIL
jgi:hypothetical protein